MPTIFEIAVTIVFGILYTLIVIALILIIAAIYKLKGEYDYGEGLQHECSPVFMEKERGEHAAFEAYSTSFYTNLENIYNKMLSSCIIIIICAYILTLIYSPLVGETAVFARCMGKCGQITVSTKGNWLFYKDINIGPLKSFALIPCVLIIIYIILLSLWVDGTYPNMKDAKSFNISALRNLTGGAPKKLLDKEITPDEKKAILRSQSLMIHSIFLIMLAGCAIYNPVVDNKPLITPTTVMHLLVIYVILAVSMPLVMSTILDMQNTIGYGYHTYKTNLYNAITEVGSKNRIVKELEKNIMRSEPDRETPPDLLRTNNVLTYYKTTDDLYKYVVHVINNYDIQTIQIPQELKSILNTTYLGGENIVELKRKLSDVYHRHKDAGTLIKLEDFGEMDKDLLPYLNTNARLAIIEKRANTYIKLLNVHVVSNTAFRKANPLPQNIIDIMTTRRQDTSMKDTIYKNFNAVNNVLTVFLILIGYLIYHYCLHNNANQQNIALVACVVLLLIGALGWLTKEFWL